MTSKDRLKTIDTLVDALFPNDSINLLIQKYSDELTDYKYIDNVGDFSLLPLRGTIRYINKYSKEIRFGGLLIKIYQKENKNWYAILKKFDGKKYHVSFNSNYIFYCETKEDALKRSLQYFITEYENGNIDVV